MSLEEFYNDVKATSGNKNSFYLASGANVVRLLAQPIKIDTAFCVAKYEDTKTKEEKTIKRSEIVYPNCGYQQYSSAKFVAYAIDSKDPRNEDGSPKIKTLEFGWKVLEGLVEQEKSRVLQGMSAFSFPMSLDVIISKNGSGQTNTTYSVAVMLSEANNKVDFAIDELESAVKALPTLREWKEALIAETIARHEKFGKPKAEKELKEIEDHKKALEALPTVQVGESDGIEYPEDQINAEDIPF